MGKEVPREEKKIKKKRNFFELNSYNRTKKQQLLTKQKTIMKTVKFIITTLFMCFTLLSFGQNYKDTIFSKSGAIPCAIIKVDSVKQKIEYTKSLTKSGEANTKVPSKFIVFSDVNKYVIGKKIIPQSQVNKTKNVNISQQRTPVVSLIYVGNFPSLPGGCGLFFHHKKISFLTTMKFGSSEIGTYRSAYDNSGIYQIGTWGNIATGVQDSYTQSSIFRMDFGLGYNVYNKNDFFVKPYVGVGFTNRNSTTERYVQAEDVSSGFNVLGYYWVKNGTSTKTDNTPNFTFGCLMEKKWFSFGMGYDFNPNGVVLMAGFNF